MMPVMSGHDDDARCAAAVRRLTSRTRGVAGFTAATAAPLTGERSRTRAQRTAMTHPAHSVAGLLWHASLVAGDCAAVITAASVMTYTSLRARAAAIATALLVR